MRFANLRSGDLDIVDRMAATDFAATLLNSNGDAAEPRRALARARGLAASLLAFWRSFSHVAHP